MAFASWWYKMHANEKTNGSSSKQGEKKGPDENKAASFGSTQPARTHAAGAAVATKASVSSASANKSSSMNSTEPKAIPVSKQMEEQPSPNKKRHKRQKEPEKKSQPSEPAVTQEKKEAKTKEHTEPKSLSKHTSDTRKKHAEKEKAASKSSEQSAPEKAAKPKDTTAVRESVDGAVSAASDKPEDKSGMDDAALDDLIDTLGEPEETEDNNTTYTGPEVSDPMFSKYVEELGKREVTIPPKYRELLNKNEGTIAPPPDSSKPMGPDDAIDALSSDFTCSSNTGEKKTDKEKSTGEVLKAQSAKVSKSAAPPQEKKRKVEEDSMSDQALEALSASLGHRKSEPELDLSSIKEVDEAKAKEEKLKKCGEDDETVPAEYRLKAVTDKDGKPLLPTQEEKSKPLSESELIDELSEDFDRSKCKEKQSKSTEKTEKPQASASTPVEEAVPQTSMCTIQSAPPKPAVPKETVSDDAVEALAGSLGKKEAEPEDAKPVEDKVKDKAKEEDREKLGEKEETIPPEYRLEVKDKDGKPLLPQKAKEPLPAMTEDFLLDALSEDFAGPTNTSSLKFEDAKLSAVISEVVSQTPAPATHAAGPPPDTSEEHMFLEEKPIRGGVGLNKFREVHREKVPPTDVRGSVLSTLHSDLGETPGAQSDDKARDDALDQLSDSLGQRQPDADDDKPLEDKVKERAKAEHRDKLGERDDTIPPEYRHLLDNDNEGKPKKPPTKKPQASKKTSDDQDPIDTLSGDFDSCPSTTETSENRAKDKEKKAASNTKAPKSGGKAKSSAKAKEETSKPKASEKNSS